MGYPDNIGLVLVFAHWKRCFFKEDEMLFEFMAPNGKLEQREAVLEGRFVVVGNVRGRVMDNSASVQDPKHLDVEHDFAIDGQRQLSHQRSRMCCPDNTRRAPWDRNR